MWGSWYFPMFPLRAGSCTQMNIASLMVLEWLLTSLCTMLNCSTYRTEQFIHTEQFNIVYKEVNSHSRTIKEAMFICVQEPALNRNIGKYQLPHIWDHLLQVSPTLQCKPSNHPTTPPPPNPPTGSPHASHFHPLFPILPLSIMIGGTNFLYGKHTRLS